MGQDNKDPLQGAITPASQTSFGANVKEVSDAVTPTLNTAKPATKPIDTSEGINDIKVDMNNPLTATASFNPANFANYVMYKEGVYKVRRPDVNAKPSGAWLTQLMGAGLAGYGGYKGSQVYNKMVDIGQQPDAKGPKALMKMFGKGGYNDQGKEYLNQHAPDMPSMDSLQELPSQGIDYLQSLLGGLF